MNRITLEMSVVEIISAISEGNAGAIKACTEMFTKGEEIDPQSFAGAITGLLALDSMGIYGSRIWMFYTDVCKRDVRDMIMLTRAVQLGIINAEQLNRAIDNRGSGIDMPAVDEAVCAQLSGFKRKVAPEPELATDATISIDPEATVGYMLGGKDPLLQRADTPEPDEIYAYETLSMPPSLPDGKLRRYWLKFNQMDHNIRRTENRGEMLRASHWFRRSLYWVRQYNLRLSFLLDQQGGTL